MVEKSVEAVKNPVAAPGLGGAIAYVIVYVLGTSGVIETPAPEMLVVAITTIVTFITQRLIRHL